jgi:GT2 family glycosyltransferase
LPECLDGGAPLAVRLIDIDHRATEFRLSVDGDRGPYRRLLALIRNNGRPLGWVALPVARDGTASLAGLVDSVDLTSEPPASLAPATGAPLSVVVTTCADADAVVRCVDGILACADEQVEIVVVENRPILSRVERRLSDHYGDDQRVRYVEEHDRGLSRARNAGLRAARGDLVAFTDDDILVDHAWLSAIRTGFALSPDIDCVTGLILPCELETPAQVLVERFASFGKGFARRIYSLDDPPADQPLFPYTAGYFGSGANMAFRTASIRRLGGFDPMLGAGTGTRGGEDLDICIRLLQAGGRLAYEPGAIVWHRHPDTGARLRRQVFGYGMGLGAMLSKHIITGPDRWSIASRAPEGIRYFTDPDSRKNAARGAVFPRNLSRLERLGVICGPSAYLTTRLRRHR